MTILQDSIEALNLEHPKDAANRNRGKAENHRQRLHPRIGLRIGMVVVQPVQRLGRRIMGRPEDIDRRDDKDRRHAFRGPGRIKITEHRLKPDRHRKRRHPRAHPSCKGALVRQNRAVFGPVGAVLGQIIAFIH